MTPHPLPLLTLSAALLAAFPAIAADAIGDTLPRIDVTETAPRKDLLPDDARNLLRSAASSRSHVQIITRDMIEEIRPRDVFELLDNATGVQSTQGSRKGFSGLSIRGDSEFRWVIDGAMLQPTMASRILRALPVSAIEQVEIIRGGSALTFGPMVGSASPGGAPVDGFVVLRTRKPLKSEVQARLALESYQTGQASVWGGAVQEHAEGSTYVAGLAAHATTNGPREALDNGADYNVGRSSSSGMAKAGLDMHGWLVDMLLFRDDGTFEVPNANSHGSGQGSWYMDPSKTDIAILSGSKAWSDRHTTLFALSHSESEQTFWTANTPAGPYAFVQNDNEVTHLNLRHNIDFAHTRVLLGGDLLHWDAPNGQQYYEGIRREEKTKGLFAQIEHSLLDDRLKLDASLRRDRVDVLHGLDYYIGGRQPFGGVNSPLITEDNLLPPAKFFSLGASALLGENWRLNARYGEAEQASDGLNPRPDVVFEDDTQRKFEIGLEANLFDGFSTSINAFRRKVENEKTQDGYTYLATNGTSQICTRAVIPTSGPLSPRDPSNVTPCYGQQDTLRGGLEWTANGVLPVQGSYRLSWTHFTDFVNAEAITPKDMAEASLSQPIGPVRLNASAKHVSAYRGATADAQAWLGGYTRYDLGLAYDFELAGIALRSSVFGRNLTDERYETRNGVQDIGRVYGVELLANF